MNVNAIAIALAFLLLFFIAYQIFGKNERLKGIFYRTAYIILILYVGSVAFFALLNMFYL